ncbi:MAG: hypothetical protein ACTSSP_04405 [Candidatus Asgardarchaeia archaeon]
MIAKNLDAKQVVEKIVSIKPEYLMYVDVLGNEFFLRYDEWGQKLGILGIAVAELKIVKWLLEDEDKYTLLEETFKQKGEYYIHSSLWEKLKVSKDDRIPFPKI